MSAHAAWGELWHQTRSVGVLRSRKRGIPFSNEVTSCAVCHARVWPCGEIRHAHVHACRCLAIVCAEGARVGKRGDEGAGPADQATQVPPRQRGRLASPIGLRMTKASSRKTMFLLKGG